ncbi:response regulator [Fulvivirga ligni]|uniref:response regulator n=1 Tax=Fulvivirga ligni TaxID=2904246 RepID=UPI001F1C2513|nr:response regulator [Fulvivirga ligni]UII20653.1 response regulator [Fulvivirga ligni]
MNSKSAEVVMLIDDNEIDVFINQKVLEFDQFAERIITYYSAKEALTYLAEAPIQDIPDVIFLDLNMPVIDGFKFLEEYSTFSDQIREKVTIIVLTSSDNSNDKERIKNNSDVLLFQSKPITEQKLENIRKLLK